jgi:hypothetical protein
MEDIPTNYKNSGYSYTLVDNKPLQNGDIMAIYKQNELQDTYEVVQLRWQKEGTIFGKPKPAYWRIPSDSEWGHYGWTVQGLDRATNKLTLRCAQVNEKYHEKVSRQA